MNGDRLVFEAYVTAGGVCMTPTAFAAITGTPPADVLQLMDSWSLETRDRCVWQPQGRCPAMLTLAGVVTLFQLVSNNERLMRDVVGRMTILAEAQRWQP